MNEPQDLIERLAPDECRELLGSTTVGRLAVIVDHRPDIFPVNYVLDQGSIVFHTGVGTKFWATMKDRCPGNRRLQCSDREGMERRRARPASRPTS
ncbi:pyridoxamine 5'-phosphate oxidase family protein [Arthrobacter sp. 4R501]|uniref:pyridoxamine 5'-phosphate oxidase family protein n=1 Tax=Arthrobacter sp. 4R501 TaxID=2058886 RepID=UPI002157393E|nr:pyridoxamine 5'-phosphate oxidase family protein [Arthrobacter sp. 4R501]